MVVRSRAPVRIDFAGGWTDVAVFADSVGGAVVSATIDKYVHGHMRTMDSGQPSADPARHVAQGAEWQVPGEGITVAYHSDLPAGSGLGTSATLNVVWLSLVRAQPVDEADRATLAELAYDLERILGILGGRQDQYASAFGGVNYLTFGGTTRVERLHLDPGVIAELEDRLVLCYTGRPRLSSTIHHDVWESYRSGSPTTVQALYGLRQVAGEVRTALLSGDVERFGTLLNQNWEYQKALHASVSNAQIEHVFEHARRRGAVAGKACGAGGGGCLLFLSAAGGKSELEGSLAELGVRVIPFRFEFGGLTVEVDQA